MSPTNLDKLPCYSRLQELSGAPYDLTGKGAVSSGRIKETLCHSAGFDLLYGCQRVDDTVLDGLQALADESGVIDQFVDMKKGAVMNRIAGYECENRQVLHTATRDVFNDTPHESVASSQARGELAKLQQFLADLADGRIVNTAGERFTDMIQVGIGGSDLGPRALYHALAAFRVTGRAVHFISNVDPDDAAAVLQELDLSRTLVNVVSKSGGTLETLTNEELVRQAYREAGLDPLHHFVAVTGEGSPMDDQAAYLRSFYMYDYIGGRYSATSMVGGVMLGFALGYEHFMDILRGASEMDEAAEEKNIRHNIPLLMALFGVWNHNFLGSETVAVLPYSQALVRFTAHLQQCDMESNGKSINRQGEQLSYQSGPIVWGEPGTNGQHAFYQLIHQGTTVIPVEFIGFRRSQYGKDSVIKGTTSQEKLLANLLAQSLALATGQDDENPNKRFPGNRPNSVLVGEQLTPKSMGALLALYEAKIAFQGFLWNINSFDQEGVQLGKKLANQLLDHFASLRGDASYVADGDDSGWAIMQAAGVIKTK